MGEKCIEAFNAEIIALNLKGADPNGRNRDVEEVINVVKDVVGAVSVPVIVWGTSNDEKDAVLLRRVAEACEGKNVSIGPLSEKTTKQIGAMAPHTITSGSRHHRLMLILQNN